MKAKDPLPVVAILVQRKAERTAMTIMVFLIFFLTRSPIARAQHNVLSVGATSALTITSGTIFSADSLVFTPTSDFTMASNSILETPVAVPGAPTNSITRVYYLGSPITFTGIIQLYYQLTELNGNTESALRYNDSTTGSFWLTAASSTDNSVSHFVQRQNSARMLVAVTATQSGMLLFLKLLSFTGYWDGNQVELAWIVEQNEESSGFTVESSIDGQSWQTVADVPGSQVAGQYKYNFNDKDGAFSTRLYRIKLLELSGETSYSSVITINKASTIDNVYVAAKNNGATIYFNGAQPKAVRLINSIGQIIWMDNSSRNQYEMNNLKSGIYFVQYELNGRLGVKQFGL